MEAFQPNGPIIFPLLLICLKTGRRALKNPGRNKSLRALEKNKSPILLVFGSVYGVTFADTYYSNRDLMACYLLCLSDRKGGPDVLRMILF